MELSYKNLLNGLLIAGVMSMLPLPTHAQSSPPTTPLKIEGMRRSQRSLSNALNTRVLQFAESKRGQQVGRGECWDLADEALNSAGAHRPNQAGYGAYVFGQAVALTALKAGDILQFENVNFKHTSPNGSWSSNSFPHHTAVVRSVQGRQIELLQQNVKNDRHVQTGTINLDDRQAGGTITAYRPQGR